MYITGITQTVYVTRNELNALKIPVQIFFSKQNDFNISHTSPNSVHLGKDEWLENS